MDDAYDPLSHLSTAFHLLPRTIAGIGFSLPVGLSEVAQTMAFFDHLHDMLLKDQNPGTKSLEKFSGPNPNTTEKEGDEARKNRSEEQKHDLKLASLEIMEKEPQSCANSHVNELSANTKSLKVESDETGNSNVEGQNLSSIFKTAEPTKMKQKPSTGSKKSKPISNPDNIDEDETAKSSSEWQKKDVKLEPLETMQLEQQPSTNSYANGLSPNPDRLVINRLETGNGGQDQDKNFSFESVKPMEVEPRPSINSHANNPGSSPNNFVLERDETGKDSYEGHNGDMKIKSVEPTNMEPQPNTIFHAIPNKSSVNPGNTEAEREKTGNSSFVGQNEVCNSKTVELMEMEQQPSISRYVDKLSSNPDSTVLEQDETGKISSEGQKNSNFRSVEPMEMEQQPSISGYVDKLSPSPDSVVLEKDETEKISSEGQKNSNFRSVEPTEMKQQPSSSSYVDKLSPNPDNTVLEKDETGKISSEWQKNSNFRSVEPMEMEQQPSISRYVDKLSSNPDSTVLEQDETGKISSEGQKNSNFRSVEPMEMEQQPSISGYVDKLSPNPDSAVQEKDETGKISSEGRKNSNFRSVEPMEMEQQPSISSYVDKLSPNPDSTVLEKDETGKISSEGQKNSNFRSVEPMLEPRPSISRDSRNSNQNPEGIVGNGKKPRRPGLGLVYDIGPFTQIQKYEKTKQVVPVDFTVLNNISDQDSFPKKVYELEAAVKAIESLGGEAKIIGERVFKQTVSDQPRTRRPGLGLQLPRLEFVPIPMSPLPFKFKQQSECTCCKRAPTQSNNPPQTTSLSNGSPNVVPSGISNATKEAPEMKLPASSSLQGLLSLLENCPEEEEKAVAMVFEALYLEPNVVPPLVIPEMPKFCRLDVRSPWRQLSSMERMGEERGEDPLVAFQELKRTMFVGSPITYDSDDDTNTLVGVGSVRSLRTSPGWSEKEGIDMPSQAGPSGIRIVEVEEFPSQEKATSDASGGNISDEDFDIPEEPEMGSPWDNSPVNMEEVAPREASNRKRKNSGLEHADSLLDMRSENLLPASDGNPEEATSLVEPPKKRGRKGAPKKKNTNKQKSSIQSFEVLFQSSGNVVEGGLQEAGGVRRSTRIRSRPLRHWMGERFLYGCINDNFPGAVGVKECSPATVGMRVKVKSFVSSEHADLVARLAK